MKPTKITNRNIMFGQPMNADYDLNIGLMRSSLTIRCLHCTTSPRSVAL